ncbi:MAG: ABC transporter ATP-binding protein [Candidatus Aminicenantes bacterium]|nr:ABC transporter ATP-binding protein [Candidatus Aminicenantes bacterium]
MTKSALQIESLSFSINGASILKDICVTIGAGEKWSVIGANGAGKSTLLKCLLRIHSGWTGSVRLFGRCLNDYSQRNLARKVAYVPQPGDDQRFPFTVRQFVAMGRYAYSGMFATANKDDDAVVKRAMRQARVQEFAERTLETLSGGERQKVFIAAALAQQADLLLLDEPTAFLDYRHQVEVSRILGEINQRHGTTIMAVTHDVNTAILTDGLVLAFKQGRTAWIGPAADLTKPGRLEDIFDTRFRFIEDPVTGRRLVMAQEERQ